MSVDTRTWDISTWYPTTMISYANEEYAKRDFESIKKLKEHLNSLYGVTPFTNKCKFEFPSLILTQCRNCIHACKSDDGKYICKYSTKGGKPERDTCNYERKKR